MSNILYFIFGLVFGIIISSLISYLKIKWIVSIIKKDVQLKDNLKKTFQDKIDELKLKKDLIK